MLKERPHRNNIFKINYFPSLQGKTSTAAVAAATARPVVTASGGKTHGSFFLKEPTKTRKNTTVKKTRETGESGASETQNVAAEEAHSEITNTQTIHEDEREESSEEVFYLVINKGTKRKTRSRASSESDSEQKGQELCLERKPHGKNEDKANEEEEISTSEEDSYFPLDMTDTDT